MMKAGLFKKLISGFSFSLIFFFGPAAALFSCSQSETSRQYIADQMNPFARKHVNYAVYTRISDSKLTVFFSLQIPRNELSFIQTPEGFKTTYSLHLSVKKGETDIVLDTLVIRSKLVDNFEKTKEFVFEKIHIQLPEGRGLHKIEGVFSDENSKSDFRIVSGYTLEPNEHTFQLSSLRFLETTEKGSISLTKRLVAGGQKGSSFNFDVGLAGTADDVKVELVLNRLKSDTVVARPIWGLNPIDGTIETRGYKPDKIVYSITPFDTLLSTDIHRSIEFTVPLPDTLKPGVFTGQVFLRSGDQVFTSKKETFYIFPKGYPYVKSIREAVEIVRYLATSGEYESIIEGGDSLIKQNFDKFWLRLANGNVEAAKRKIALFYQRAEEANYLFSTYKPGWKTDVGMLYIVLGPPVNVEWKPTELTWYYNYRRAGTMIPLSFNPIRVDDAIVGYSFDRYFDYYTYDDFWLEYRREWEKNIK